MWNLISIMLAFFGVISILAIGRLTKSILLEAMKDTLIVGITVGSLVWVTGRFCPEDPQQLLQTTLVNFLEFYHLYQIHMGVFVSLFCLSLLIRWQHGKTVVLEY